jgi:hypothetical protein
LFEIASKLAAALARTTLQNSKSADATTSSLCIVNHQPYLSSHVWIFGKDLMYLFLKKNILGEVVCVGVCEMKKNRQR